MEDQLLNIEDLTIAFQGKHKLHTVVNHINMQVNKGEIVGIVGESGSGKSMTSLAVMGLLPQEAQVLDGRIMLNGENLLDKKPEEICRYQGSKLSMVFQEPMTSLNPVMKIGSQVGESLRIHTDYDKKKMDEMVIEALQSVGLSDAENIAQKYPHQLSGGMRQRVMVAMAIINHPELIIADEPTTALDVTVQAQILRLLNKIHKDTGASILFISHDLNVIKEICHRVVVMYKGEIVEQGDVMQVLRHPEHEYTKKLVASLPKPRDYSQKTEKLLEVEKLNVYYNVKKKILSDKNERCHIVKDMSFDVYDGEIFGIVGESGCGKSTLAKTIVGLNKEYDGRLQCHDTKPQMVFQDPFSSLNPSKKIGWILEEPLKLCGIKDKQKRQQMVKEMLEQIGLDVSFAGRYARELSGGQRQRISIGCALMMNEKLIIADEPVSALDVTVQSQILDLLVRLHDERSLTYIFISHDLNIVRSICDRVIVMYLGQIVEQAEVDELYRHPQHPYTKMLFDSILKDEHKLSREEDVTVDEVQAAGTIIESGCPFYSRCKEHCELCLKEIPSVYNMGTEERKHLVRCHKMDPRYKRQGEAHE